MKRKMQKVYNKYVEDVGHCELCGSRKNLELHHIIPLCVGGGSAQSEFRN